MILHTVELHLCESNFSQQPIEWTLGGWIQLSEPELLLREKKLIDTLYELRLYI